MGRRHRHGAVRRVFHLLPERLGGQRQHLGAPRLDLYHVAHGLVKQRRIRSQRNDQRPRLNEGNSAVLQLAGCVGFRMNIADLLEFQRPLHAHGIIQIPSDEEDGIVVEIPGSKVLHILRTLQHLLHILRQALHLPEDLVILALFHRPQQVAKIQGDEIHQGQLGGIGFRRCHGDFRAGPGVKHIVGFSCDGGANHIHHRQRPAAQPLGFPQGSHGIQRLAGLADENDQGVFIHQRVAVAEFRGKTYLHRAAQQPLPVVFADHAHMIAGTAGNNKDAADALNIVPRQVKVIQHHPAIPDAGRNGLADGFRLLEDLLEHEVGIAALFRGGNVPVDVAVSLFDGVHLIVEEADALRRQNGDLPVLHIDDIAGMGDNGRHVRGNEVLPFPAADDEGAVFPGRNQGVGIVGADDAEGVGAFDPPQHPAHSLQHIVALVIMELQQLGHHLRVCIRLEHNAMAQKLLLDLHIVFNDAVMHQRDPAVLADMGMGVDVIRFAVGSPAGMADAQRPFHIGAAVDHVGKHLKSALGLAYLKALGLRPHRHTGGIVPPVFHPGQTVQQNGSRFLAAHITNNSTHR